MKPIPSIPAYNLLALSDLHLGCDLKAGAPFGDERRAELDRILARFIDEHALQRRDDKRWRLLLAGDVFDFVAVTAQPGPLLTAPFPICAEERARGLAPEEEKTVWKLRRIAARHEEVFHALARFLVAGHEVHFIRGNHDAELQFPSVQRELVRLLLRRAGVDSGMEARIKFHPWFYLEPGQLYAEHGNAHDRYCLQSGFFDEAPSGNSPLELPMSSKVLRNFAARWAKEQEDVDGADTMSAFQYIAWIFRMGRPLQIAFDFFALMLRVLQPIAMESLQLWLAHSSVKNKSVYRLALQRLERERLQRVQRWLEQFPDSQAQLDEGNGGSADAPAQARSEDETRRSRAKALVALASRPAERSFFAAAQLFYADRMLLFALTAAVTAASIGFASGLGKLLGCAVSLLSFVVANRLLARRRRCDAHLLLQGAAARLSQIFAVPAVVMGHSHRQVNEKVSSEGRYFNLGAWSPSRSPGAGLPYLIRDGETVSLGSFAPGNPPERPRELRSSRPVLSTEDGPRGAACERVIGALSG